jgi:hypothetical protein
VVEVGDVQSEVAASQKRQKLVSAFCDRKFTDSEQKKAEMAQTYTFLKDYLIICWRVYLPIKGVCH